MIDRDKTFEAFGYYPEDWAPKSRKLVVTQCSNCSNFRNVSKEVALASKMCTNCQRIEQATKMGRVSKKTGKESPSFGKKRSESHKQRIAEANKSRVWSEEAKQKLSAAHKGRKLSLQQRTKMGNSRRGKRNPNYGRKAAHGKGGWFQTKQGTVWMRSTWEQKVASYLDEQHLKWDYEPTAFPIKYTYLGVEKEGTYRPDFYVEELAEYWEVKGYWRDDAQAKYNAFIAQYPHLRVILLDKNALRLKKILP